MREQAAAIASVHAAVHRLFDEAFGSVDDVEVAAAPDSDSDVIVFTPVALTVRYSQRTAEWLTAVTGRVELCAVEQLRRRCEMSVPQRRRTSLSSHGRDKLKVSFAEQRAKAVLRSSTGLTTPPARMASQK